MQLNTRICYDSYGRDFIILNKILLLAKCLKERRMVNPFILANGNVKKTQPPTCVEKARFDFIKIRFESACADIFVSCSARETKNGIEEDF